MSEDEAPLNGCTRFGSVWGPAVQWALPYRRHPAGSLCRQGWRHYDVRWSRIVCSYLGFHEEQFSVGDHFAFPSRESRRSALGWRPSHAVCAGMRAQQASGHPRERTGSCFPWVTPVSWICRRWNDCARDPRNRWTMVFLVPGRRKGSICRSSQCDSHCSGRAWSPKLMPDRSANCLRPSWPLSTPERKRGQGRLLTNTVCNGRQISRPS